MLLEKIIKGPWSRVDFKNMRMSDEDGYYMADFENFAEIKFREVAEEIGIKYDLIKDVLYGRNIEFFQTLTELFQVDEYITEDDEDFETLTGLLMIPCNIGGLNTVNTVEQFFYCFQEMSLEDKIGVVSRFNNITINTPNSGDCKASSFLSQFSELSCQEKCSIIEQIFKTSITTTSDKRRFN